MSTRSTLHGDRPCSKSPFSIDSLLELGADVQDAEAEALTSMVVVAVVSRLEVRVWLRRADDVIGRAEKIPPVALGTELSVVELR